MSYKEEAEVWRIVAIGFFIICIISVVIILVFEHKLKNNTTCPPSYTCTKTPEICYDINNRALNVYQNDKVIYQILYNETSGSHKESLYRHLKYYEDINGTEIPRCSDEN